MSRERNPGTDRCPPGGETKRSEHSTNRWPTTNHSMRTDGEKRFGLLSLQITKGEHRINVAVILRALSAQPRRKPALKTRQKKKCFCLDHAQKHFVILQEYFFRPHLTPCSSTTFHAAFTAESTRLCDRRNGKTSYDISGFNFNDTYKERLTDPAEETSRRKVVRPKM